MTGNHVHFWRDAGAALGLVLVCGVGPAAGQSSVTTEVSDPKHLDLSFDFLGSAARRSAGGFEWYLPDATVGLPRGSEVGLSWSSTVPRSAAEPFEFVPHAKLRVLGQPDASFAVAVGGEWHLPVTNRPDANRYGFVYVAASKAFESRPITITGGVYSLVHRTFDEDTRHGISFSYEQDLSDRWSLSSEWVSGDNWYGYLSSGVTLTTGRQWFYWGYCVGNSPAANHGPCVSAGRSF